eukprot:TRINITY_DN71_c0_g1_i10.p1 TRINITY_DN71_c0_g1~~TRINITY_DN71_c0_g1_i10.p1  ORF type:complete len:556 (+),score=79.12 TRINITY_DN71_c0_g1_i10:463-2130(+)
MEGQNLLFTEGTMDSPFRLVSSSETPVRSERGLMSDREEIENLRREIEQFRTQPQEKISVTVKNQREVRKFSGNSLVDGDYTVEQFVEEISNLLRKEEDPEEKIDVVMDHLEGAARSEVRNCGRPRVNVETIFDILTDAFSDRRPLSQLLKEFAERKQQMNEAVRSYANDLYARYARLQKKSGGSVGDEDLLATCFVEGLRDKGLVLDLKRRSRSGYRPFWQIREAALEWEEMLGSAENCCTAGKGSVTETDQLTEKMLQVLRAENERLRHEIKSLKERKQCRRPRTEKRVCFNCGLSGHIRRFCRQRVAKQSRNPRPMRPLGVESRSVKRGEQVSNGGVRLSDRSNRGSDRGRQFGTEVQYSVRGNRGRYSCNGDKGPVKSSRVQRESTQLGSQMRAEPAGVGAARSAQHRDRRFESAKPSGAVAEEGTTEKKKLDADQCHTSRKVWQQVESDSGCGTVGGRKRGSSGRVSKQNNDGSRPRDQDRKSHGSEYSHPRGKDSRRDPDSSSEDESEAYGRLEADRIWMGRLRSKSQRGVTTSKGKAGLVRRSGSVVH